MWGFFIYYICGMATPIKNDPPEDEGLDILQALANIYNWKENLAENIAPYGYEKEETTGYNIDKYGFGTPIIKKTTPLERLYNTIVLNQPEEGSLSDISSRGDDVDDITKERLDLLNKAIGRDSESSALVSDYKPTKSKNPDAVYYRSPATEKAIYDAFSTTPNQETLLQDLIKEASEQSKKGGVGGVLGRFTIDLGEDEKGKYISYYDKWDLNPLRYNELKLFEKALPQGSVESFEESAQKALGVNPVEVYGRVYLKDLPIGTTSPLSPNYSPSAKMKLLLDYFPFLDTSRKKKYGGTIRPLRKYRVLK